MKNKVVKPLSLILVIVMVLSAALPAFSGNAAVEFAFTCAEAVSGEELAVTISVQSDSTEVDGLIEYNSTYDNY